ncbi:hypothetical protein BH23ACT2_BH23ACT2_07910 [soil metagenome]
MTGRVEGRARTLRIAVAVVAVITVLVAASNPAGETDGGLAGGDVDDPGPFPEEPAPPPLDDPDLRRDLDAVIALSPEDSCLAVEVNGAPAYRHDADRPLIPASTQKLRTALVALERLGGDHRFVTEVVATSAPVDGVINGDLGLVGGGDPALMTNEYRLARRIGEDGPATSLDALADEVAASGVIWVAGRVVGDESRYDQVRSVASWPDRYLTQGVSGPLSALTVDEGYTLRPARGGGSPVRDRSADPASDAAAQFSELLRKRGIVILGEAEGGAAAEGSVEVASARSAPLTDTVRQMLLTSDNQVAELLVKELGHSADRAGSTAEGVAVLTQTLTGPGRSAPASTSVDGSGLDRSNRMSCDELVGLLASSGGAQGLIGPSLPVAGESGTLAGRFQGNPAEGRLAAKTGALSEVSALAGFVSLPGGGTATVAYVANGAAVDATAVGVQEVLGSVLGTYVPPCEAGPSPLDLPLTPYAAAVGALAAFPATPVVLTGTSSHLVAFEERRLIFGDRCRAPRDRDDPVVGPAASSEPGPGGG